MYPELRLLGTEYVLQKQRNKGGSEGWMEVKPTEKEQRTRKGKETDNKTSVVYLCRSRV